MWAVMQTEVALATEADEKAERGADTMGMEAGAEGSVAEAMWEAARVEV